MSLVTEIRLTLIQHMRSYRFLLIAAVSIFVGFLCVPAATAGYEVFYLGGVRGIYNSAWLGASGALLPTILLWLPGFYMLRNSISEDIRLKLGPMLAATPMSKLRYILSKTISHFVVLLSLSLLFSIALIGMQFIRQESSVFVIWDYIEPMLVLNVPYLVVLAALTVFFDTVPGIKGIFGNILAFITALTLLMLSVALPGNAFDLFGIGPVLSAMAGAARMEFPNLPEEIGSFGYYPVEGAVPTFVWEGMTWTSDFLAGRLIWIGIAVVLVGLAVLFFRRFEEKGNMHNEAMVVLAPEPLTPALPIYTKASSKPVTLTPISSPAGFQLHRLVGGELRLMLHSLPIWWYAASVIGIGLSFWITYAERHWLALILLLILPIWSQMGYREKHFFTRDLIAYSCPPATKWWATWIAAVLLSLLVSAGMIIRLLLDAEPLQATHVVIGLLFMSTLAFGLGRWSGTRKLFEALFIAWLYTGPLNQTGKLDFLGLSEGAPLFYIIGTAVLMLLGILTTSKGVRR